MAHTSHDRRHSGPMDPIPLPGNSVFVHASPPLPTPFTPDTAETPNSSFPLMAQARSQGGSGVASTSFSTLISSKPSSSSSPPSSHNNQKGPRRSRAHRPSLLGLMDDSSEGASEEVLLAGLATRHPRQQQRGIPHSNAHLALQEEQGAEEEENEEQQFRIADDGEEEDETTSGLGRAAQIQAEKARPAHKRHVSLASSVGSSMLRSNGAAVPSSIAETTPGYFEGYDDVDIEASVRGEDDQDYNYADDLEAQDGLFGGRQKLPFEPITKRERTWMTTSLILVAALATVSIAIAVGWIDWPGDGLGNL